MSNSSVNSPTSSIVPISPFSRTSDRDGARTSSTQYTSDEQPDLGAFRTVFREWGYLQPQLRIPQYGADNGLHGNTWSSTSMNVSGSWVGNATVTAATSATSERRKSWSSGVDLESTVWDQSPIAQHFRSVDGTSTDQTDKTPSPPGVAIGSFRNTLRTHSEGRRAEMSTTVNVGTDSDGTEGARSVAIGTVGGTWEDTDSEGKDAGSSILSETFKEVPSTDKTNMHFIRRTGRTSEVLDLDSNEYCKISSECKEDCPSLGYLEEALSFIAAERARWETQRFSGISSGSLRMKSARECLRKKWRKRMRWSVMSVSNSANKFTVGDATLSANEEEEEEYEGEDETALAFSSRPKNRIRKSATAKIKTKFATLSDSVNSTSAHSMTNPHGQSSAPYQILNATNSDESSIKSSSRSLQASMAPIRNLERANSAPTVRNKHNSNGLVANGTTRVKAKMNEVVTPTLARLSASSSLPSEETLVCRRRRLLALTKEMKKVFPAEKSALANVQMRLRKDILKEGEEMDLSRHAKGGSGTLIHIFIDHSNILFGLLRYLKRHPSLFSSMSPVSGRRRTKSISIKSGKIGKKANKNNDSGTNGSTTHLPISTASKPLRESSKLRFSSPSPSLINDVRGLNNHTHLVRESATTNYSTFEPVVTEFSTSPTTASAISRSATFRRATTLSTSSEEQSLQTLLPKLPIALPSFATAAHLLSSPSSSVTNPDTRPMQKKQMLSITNAAIPTPPILIPCPVDRTTSDDVLLLGGPNRNGAGEDVYVGGACRSSDALDCKKAEDEWYDEPMGRRNVGTVYEQRNRGEKFKVKNKKKHFIWHTALALILERGRQITRRVCVASSPLYQPIDAMERLGYEVRIYLRVPDLENSTEKEKVKRRCSDPVRLRKTPSGGVSADFSAASLVSAAAPTYTSLESDESDKWSKGSRISLASEMLGTSSSVASSSDAVMLASSVLVSKSGMSSHGHHLHSLYQPIHLQADRSQNQRSPHRRIRYKEQGVDELLQLKLHQAIAATDKVPNGSTIVLATGDGNAGQFNEDGFLGPVRTALRRGWKVELYAWEEGLSRAWRKEFGLGSEWEQTGKFKIINLEQFATYLVRGGISTT